VSVIVSMLILLNKNCVCLSLSLSSLTLLTFGLPVDPEVYMISARWSLVGGENGMSLFLPLLPSSMTYVHANVKIYIYMYSIENNNNNNNNNNNFLLKSQLYMKLMYITQETRSRVSLLHVCMHTSRERGREKVHVT
jgi:hypothetical protein